MSHLRSRTLTTRNAPVHRWVWYRRTAIGGLTLLGVCLAGTAPAQPSSGGRPAARPSGKAPVAVAGKSFLERVIQRRNPTEWKLQTFIHLDSYQSTNVGSPTKGPGAGTPGQSPVTIIPFNFETAAIVFPVPPSTAGSEMPDRGVTGRIRMDGTSFQAKPTWIPDLPCGAKYGRWDLTTFKGRAIDLEFETLQTCWEIVFDEAAANKAVWPTANKWSADARSAWDAQLGIEPGLASVREALSKWCEGKPPQSIPPVQLAKFLASKVLEGIQPSGDGLVSSQTGLLQGFALKGHDTVLKDSRGSEHDIAALLCALYRAAGLPARIIIGFDVSESDPQTAGLVHNGEGAVHTWVEFCVEDETVLAANGFPTRLWIPVDVARQRKTSNKAPPLDRPWKYFGSSDQTDSMIPLAFHFHPPLSGAVAHGSPLLWGWMTTPEAQPAVQSIRFLAGQPSKTVTPRNGTK